MHCEIGIEIDGRDRLALYRLPREERIARLAMRWGPWTDEEMHTATTLTSGNPGFQVATAEAADRLAKMAR